MLVMISLTSGLLRPVQGATRALQEGSSPPLYFVTGKIKNQVVG